MKLADRAEGGKKTRETERNRCFKGPSTGQKETPFRQKTVLVPSQLGEDHQRRNDGPVTIAVYSTKVEGALTQNDQCGGS